MTEIHNIIKALFDKHGYTCQINNGWLDFGSNYPALRAEIFQNHENSIQLDISLALSNEQILIESFSGIGDNQNSQLKDAVNNFTLNSFHTILCAFYNFKDNEQDIEVWTVKDNDWNVFIGPYGLRTMNSEGKDNFNAEMIPKELIEKLQRSIEQLHLNASQDYWFRTFYAHKDKKCIVTEALLNNSVMSDIQSSISNIKWPESDEFYSVRNFIVLRPKNQNKIYNYSNDVRVVENVLSRIIELCTAKPDINDNEIINTLLKERYSEPLINRVIVFGPIAFSSVILRDAKLSDEFRMVDNINSFYKLDDEPAFCAASKLAWSIAGESEYKDAFHALASRCARMNVLNQVLEEKKVEISELSFQPMVISLDGYKEEIPKQYDSSKKKPFWKFWQQQ
jgi:hypothetical protein